MKTEWFLFSPNDYIDGTRHLNLEERGAYIDLICLQMIEDGPIPGDMKWLACKMHISARKVVAVLRGLMGGDKAKLKRAADGQLYNERCLKEIKERAIRHESRSHSALARERAKVESASGQGRVSIESASSQRRATVENAEKPNENNKTKARRCSEKSTEPSRAPACVTLTVTDTGSEVSIPPAPLVSTTSQQGGSSPPTPSARKSKRKQEGAEVVRRMAPAFELFNKAAEHWGFHACRAETPERAYRLEKRIDAIGGLDRFRVALRAIGRDDFLMGRTPTKPGQRPFVLDIDVLLQTDGKLGDVLGRLLDAAESGDAEAQVSPDGTKRWGWWHGKEDRIRELSADHWRRAIATVRPNGTWPWWDLGAPPGHDECMVHPDVQAERGLVEIYRGKIKHE